MKQDLEKKRLEKTFLMTLLICRRYGDERHD